MKHRRKNIRGSHRGGVIFNGQWNKLNRFCPTCRAFKSKHAEGCKGKFLKITPTAKVPRKTASEKQWRKFIAKFCDPSRQSRHGPADFTGDSDAAKAWNRKREAEIEKVYGAPRKRPMDTAPAAGSSRPR